MADKKYTIYANVQVECSITIAAGNLNEAVEKAQKLRPSDFINCKGECMDWSSKIVGILLDYPWPEEK